MPSPAEVLSKVPLFTSCSRKEIEKLARAAHVRDFPAGTVMSEEEGFGHIFTVIVEGEASVSVKGHHARTLHSGDFFGEMALIDRSPRSATVTAETECTCLMLTQPVFRPFAVSHPDIMWALLELMVERVRQAEARED